MRITFRLRKFSHGIPRRLTSPTLRVLPRPNHNVVLHLYHHPLQNHLYLRLSPLEQSMAAK